MDNLNLSLFKNNYNSPYCNNIFLNGNNAEGTAKENIFGHSNVQPKKSGYENSFANNLFNVCMKSRGESVSESSTFKKLQNDESNIQDNLNVDNKIKLAAKNSSNFLNDPEILKDDNNFYTDRFNFIMDMTAPEFSFQNNNTENWNFNEEEHFPLEIKENSFARNFLDSKHFENIIQLVKGIDLKRIQEKRNKSNGFILDSLGSGKKIVIKPSGKIYACFDHLGNGNYKTTEKALLVGLVEQESPEEIKREKPKFCALSLPIDSQVLQTETLREYEINSELIKLKKQNKELSHVNVSKSITRINSRERIVISSLYDGDVNKLIESNALTQKEKYFISMQMSKGVGQLHEVGIVHRDCKPDNFLYKRDKNNEITKIVATDFGFSSFVNYKEDNLLKNIIYLPIIECNLPTKSYAPSSDIYQLGITFIQLQLGISDESWKELVYSGARNLSSDLIQHISIDAPKIRLWKLRPENWTDMDGNNILDQIKDAEVKEFILRMISQDRNMRPTHNQVTAFFERKVQEC